MTDNPTTSPRATDENLAPPMPSLGFGKSMVFLVVTLVFLLALVEFGWRLAVAVGVTVPPTDDRGKDEEWEWVRAHETGGDTIFADTNFQFDPHMGWVNSLNYRSPGVNTNAHGQRGFVEWLVDRVEGKKRILLVGDSYSFGYQVADEEAFAHVLNERYLPDWEVINWAVCGYGTDQQVLLYENMGIEFKPDIVILGFYTRDLFRNGVNFRSYLKPMFQLEGDQLVLATAEIQSPTDLLEDYRTGRKTMVPDEPYLVEYLGRMLDKLGRRSVEDSDEWPITAKILEQFAARVRAEGGEPFLLIIPHDEVLEKEGSATEETANLLSAKAGELNLPCLDLIPVLREKQKSDPRPLYDGHFTPWGHEVTAEALRQSLLEKGLIPPQS